MKADLILVEEVRNGHRSSFSELVNRHQKMLLRLSLRMTRDLEMAEDIVQESFLKAFRKIHSFEGRSSFKSWLYQITLNTARNRLRKKSKETVSMEGIPVGVNSVLEAQVYQDNVQEIIRKQIDLLPEKQKMALSLRIFEDLSFKEIAEIMDCPYDTAKANYRHALLKLRHSFSEDDELKELNSYEESYSMDQKVYMVEVE